MAFINRRDRVWSLVQFWFFGCWAIVCQYHETDAKMRINSYIYTHILPAYSTKWYGNAFQSVTDLSPKIPQQIEYENKIIEWKLKVYIEKVIDSYTISARVRSFIRSRATHIAHFHIALPSEMESGYVTTQIPIQVSLNETFSNVI